MRVILCEDNAQQRRNLHSIISKYTQFHEQNIEIVLSATKPEEVTTYLTNHNADCYFLDIELNSNLNGFDLAKKIRDKDPLANIIFITTFADKLKLTFTYKLAALDFILKEDSNLESSIILALKVAYEKYNKIHFKDDKFFTVKVGELVRKIRFEDIYYFETSLSPHRIILREKNGYYEFNGNLKDTKDKLDDRFFRCHRSYIINLQYIDKLNIKKREVSLINGAVCYVSFPHLKTIKHYFLENQKTVSTK
jgi:two-component system, LytTR family, response regulator AgrA